MKQRVVVTGLGSVSPLGLNTSELWQQMVRGASGLRFLSSFDGSLFPVKVVGEIPDFPFDECSPLSRTNQLLLLAGREASAHAALEDLPDTSRCGIYCGRTSDWPTLPDLIHAYQVQPGWPGGRQTRAEFANYRIGLGPSLLGELLGIDQHLTITRVIDGACASGCEAIGEAFRHIQHGQVDVALASGACSWTNFVGLTIYHKLTTLSSEAEQPAQASRPFDALRNGFVMAEGAAVLVLESLEHAQQRNVQPLAELTGYGSTTSTYRITDMPPDGLPQWKAMELALQDAALAPDELDYINAHGTSTRQNDPVETLAIHRLLGKRAWEVPVSSNKSMLGHTITASGVLEAIATVKTIQEGILPPTINLYHPDPECDLDYIPNHARQQAVRAALSNSFGFGGQNSALVIEEFTPTRSRQA